MPDGQPDRSRCSVTSATAAAGAPYSGHYTDATGEPVNLDVHMRAAPVEDNIRRLKDSGAERFPFTDFDANRVWLAVVLADGLMRRFQQLCLTGILSVAEPRRCAGCSGTPRDRLRSSHKQSRLRQRERSLGRHETSRFPNPEILNDPLA